LSKSLVDSLSEPIQRHLKILISLISSENENHEDKSKIIRRLSIIKQFLNLLRPDQKEVIYTNLKLLLYSRDQHTKFSSLETICYLAGNFPGRENDIARTLLENANSKYKEMDVQIYVVIGLESVESRITDQGLMVEVSQFIQSERNREDEDSYNDTDF
jgi:hypothetical protein